MYSCYIITYTLMHKMAQKRSELHIHRAKIDDFLINFTPPQIFLTKFNYTIVFSISKSFCHR